ncbi:hypothetical protein JTE90_012819 [Oedothorax gibbosus]|uniref:Uncharacterized protein n=1 Tax=Oedothorax gibbosus TaxID=931172 RepID=A0AAV6VZ67_9ARAC|nr:hypothetical protein JTE90_012819 [Oedothorax gibbosus]
MKVLILLCLAAAAVAQEVYAPIPYTFNYKVDTEDGGSSGHQESGDGNGKVQGSYTVTDLEGHTRTVEYVADELGFRANIQTNEPGTANLNPADVTMYSSADDNGIAAAYGIGGAAPQQPAVRPQTRPAARPSAGRQGQGVRYVLVPSTDPRAAGYAA